MTDTQIKASHRNEGSLYTSGKRQREKPTKNTTWKRAGEKDSVTVLVINSVSLWRGVWNCLKEVKTDLR